MLWFALTAIPCVAVVAAQLDTAWNSPSSVESATVDPLDAGYRLDGAMVRLQQGRAETPAAAGSASKLVTSVLGEPTLGDIDGDGDEDAALVLIHSGGGSGTFYYVTVARNVQGAYQGSNGVWLGDRILVQDVAVRYGMLIVRYLDRETHEPMTLAPTVPKTVVLHLENGKLSVGARLSRPEQLLEGWLTIGHEVRSFVPCGQGVEHWLIGSSPALGEIMAGYREQTGGAPAYTPLFAVLAGQVSKPPTEGFGADYRAAIVASRLVGMPPDGRCADESRPEAGNE